MPDSRVTYTPNLALTRLPANYHVWAQIMNDNLTMLDAAVSGFVIYDNWRGAWTNSTHYANGDTVVDLTTAVIWTTQVDHTSSSIPTTFNQEQILHPTYWVPANAPANKRGAWMPNTQYNVNDFVLADGVKYAMCLVQHVSGTVFNTDAALGYWSVLIDFTSGTATVAVGSIPPSLPITNQMWWNSDLGQLFVWYNDGNTTQWVPASPNSMISATGPISVKTFGAKGDGVTDDTVAIQAAITAADNFNPGSAPLEGARRCVFFPAGVYLTGALTINHKLALKGEGWMNTMLKLNAGVTTSMFTINAEDIPGTSVDNLNHTLFEDMQLAGNRVDAVTTGNSHGIYCPDASFPLATQYGSSFVGNRLVISGFIGNGVYVGVNRNWMELNSVVSMYNNTNGVLSYGFDHLVSGCSFGNNVQHGWRAVAGGGVEVSNTTIFYNGLYGIVLNTSISTTYHFTNGCCDFNGQGGASVSSSVPSGQVGFTNWRFNDNSTTAPGTFSHILATSIEKLSVVGCQFIWTVNQAKYLVETSSVTSVQWSGNTVPTTGTLPYSVAPFNDFSVINADFNYQTNVRFPATQVASADVNTLDDYEEGSFTPTIVSTGGGAATYAIQVGRYTKIGNQVACHFQVQISAHTGSGNMSIGGLPFVAETVTNLFFSPTFGYVDSLALTANNVLVGIMIGGTSAITLYQYPVGGGVQTVVPLDVACKIVGSITYRTV